MNLNMTFRQKAISFTLKLRTKRIHTLHIHQYCCSGLFAKEKWGDLREIPGHRSQLNKF